MIEMGGWVVRSRDMWVGRWTDGPMCDGWMVGKWGCVRVCVGECVGGWIRWVGFLDRWMGG